MGPSLTEDDSLTEGDARLIGAFADHLRLERRLSENTVRAYHRDLTPRLFVSTLNDYEHDRFQNLDLRFVAGGGLGVNLIKVRRP